MKMVDKKLLRMNDSLFKNDDINPHPDSPNFDIWLRNQMSKFTEQDWNIMKFVYNRGKADGLIK